MKSKSLLFLPIIDNENDLSSIAARIGWYLYPYEQDIESINLLINLRLPKNLEIGNSFDPAISRRIKMLLPKINLINKSTLSLDNLKNYTIFIWRDFPNRINILNGLEEDLDWFDVDNQCNPSESSKYLWLSKTLFGKDIESLDNSLINYRYFLNSGFNSKAYVVGTGPSLSTVLDHDFSDGDVYAANSIVANKSLFHKLKPKAIVAADPVFHSGCSSYAGEFRKNLIRRLEEFEFFLFIPERDYCIYLSFMPKKYWHKLIGVPYNDYKKYNIDLSKDFYVNGTSNILTLLLLPIAATHHDVISVVGCDGKNINDNQYFWSHHAQSQFNDYMNSAKTVHPGFFDIDYTEYYLEHLKMLESSIIIVEQAGKKITSMTKSYIPSLHSRYERVPRDGMENHRGRVADKLKIISISPEAGREAGHYINYEERLSQLFFAAQCKYLTACNRNVRLSTQSLPNYFIPCLNIQTYDIGNNGDEPAIERLRMARIEYNELIKRVYSKDRPEKVILYLYYGSLYHFELFRDLISEYKDISCHINLFWTAYENIQSDKFKARWKHIVGSLSNTKRLYLTVQTERLRNELKSSIGLELPLAPHPSPTFSDFDLISKNFKEAKLPKNKQLTILFPGMASASKSIKECLESADKLVTTGKFFCKLRTFGMNDAELKSVSSQYSAVSNMQLLHGELSRDEFVNMLESSDIAVILYPVIGFKKRTSGILIDAFYCGLPVIALKGTWMGDVIQAYNAGVAIDSKDSNSVIKAVQIIQDNFSYYADNVNSAAIEWHKKNSWYQLASSIGKSV